MRKEVFRIHDAISSANAYDLASYFDENIEIKSYWRKASTYTGSREAIIFFEEFFNEYKSSSDKVLIFCRFMDKRGCIPVLDEQFKEFCATHDFFIYISDNKIIKIEIFASIDFDMRFYIDD